MKRTLRVGLFVGVVACAVAASALMVRAGRAAGVGSSAARRTETGAQITAGARAGVSPTPKVSATPRGSAAPKRDERLWQRAMAIHRRAIIVDGHNDIPTIMVDEDYDIGTP